MLRHFDDACSAREVSMTKDGRHHLRGGRYAASQRLVFGSMTVLLMLLLGFGIVVQVRDNDSGDSLDTARPADLLVVLDNVGRREAALREGIAGLEDTLAALERPGEDGAALAEARTRRRALEIQVGSVPATGPGVVVTIEDPTTGVGSEILLDVLQELRAAGAEAIEVAGKDADPVRIGVRSWIAGRAGSVVVDGREMSAPFVYTAIGDPPTLSAALDIPGGVIDTVARNGGRCDVTGSSQVDVSALRDPASSQYSQPGN